MSFTFAIVRFLREDCMEIKNKEWNAGENPEEKSIRSTLTCFKGDYVFKKKTLLLSAATEFYFNAVVL